MVFVVKMKNGDVIRSQEFDLQDPKHVASCQSFLEVAEDFKSSSCLWFHDYAGNKTLINPSQVSSITVINQPHPQSQTKQV